MLIWVSRVFLSAVCYNLVTTEIWDNEGVADCRSAADLRGWLRWLWRAARRNLAEATTMNSCGDSRHRSDAIETRLHQYINHARYGLSDFCPVFLYIGTPLPLSWILSFKLLGWGVLERSQFELAHNSVNCKDSNTHGSRRRFLVRFAGKIKDLWGEVRSQSGFLFPTEYFSVSNKTPTPVTTRQ